MKRTLTIFSGLTLIFALPAAILAHGSTHAQHGGVVQMNGETLFELVRAPAGVSLYVTDEDEPVTAGSMTARLSVTVGGQRRDVAMVAGKGNQFFAKGLTLPKGASVGVLVINKASQARYGTTFAIK
ncbi:MAG: hypothetical protein ABI668_09705 [Sphingorhabdus sp.]